MTEMTEDQAREILGEWVNDNDEFSVFYDENLGAMYWFEWTKKDDKTGIDGMVTLDQLKALAWWIENKSTNMKSEFPFLTYMDEVKQAYCKKWTRIRKKLEPMPIEHVCKRVNSERGNDQTLPTEGAAQDS